MTVPPEHARLALRMAQERHLPPGGYHRSGMGSRLLLGGAGFRLPSQRKLKSLDVAVANVIYDGARICENGHLINDALTLAPENTRQFCTHCGAVGIEKCSKCQSGIYGAMLHEDYNGTLEVSQHMGILPGYCHECGNPYPWTVAKIEAAKALISEMNEFTEVDKDSLKSALPDLVCDTPRTTLAAERYKRIVGKLAAGAGEGLKQIFLEIVTEGVKRVVYPS